MLQCVGIISHTVYLTLEHLYNLVYKNKVTKIWLLTSELEQYS